MSNEARSTLMKVLAVIVLAVAAWILLRVVINVIAVVAWAVAAVIAVIAIVWAIRTLREPSAR